MKKMLLLAATLVFVATPMINAQEFKQPQKPYVEVQGMAEKRVTPNKIDITVSLSQADSKGKIPMADLEKAFSTALEQAGINIEKQVVITDQSSNSSKKQAIYQFKNYMITVQSAAQASNLFDCLSSNNVATAEIVNATHTDIDKIRSEIKIEAIRNAQSTAVTLTQAIDQKIGKAIRIQDYSTPYFGARNTVLMRANSVQANDAAAESPLNSVQFQEIRIEQRITVQFELL